MRDRREAYAAADLPQHSSTERTRLDHHASSSPQLHEFPHLRAASAFAERAQTVRVQSVPIRQPAGSTQPQELQGGDDIAVTDPIEDEDDSSSHRSVFEQQPSSPQLTLTHLTQRRLSRGENPNLTKAPDTSLSRSRADTSEHLSDAEVKILRKKNLSHVWSKKEIDSLSTALAKGLDAYAIHEQLFSHRSWDSVRSKVTRFPVRHSDRIRARGKTLAIQALKCAPSVGSGEMEKPKASEPGTSIANSTPTAQTGSNTTTSTDFPSTSLARSSPLVQSLWSQQDDENFRRAIRTGQDWRSLHDSRYMNKTDESVMKHFAEVRHQVEEEERLTRAEGLKAQGMPSSAPDQKYTQREDDLLLAARLEGTEMRRLSRAQFPLRAYDQVKSRASSLYHKASRAALKKQRAGVSSESHDTASRISADRASHIVQPTTDLVMASLDTATRNRVDMERKLLRSSDMVAADRCKEYDINMKVAKDRGRAIGYRDRAQRSDRLHMQLEEAKYREDDIQARRLTEDIKISQTYRKEYASWHKQAELDEVAGRPIQSSPERPLGSSIGTEVLVKQPAETKAVDNLTFSTGSSYRSRFPPGLTRSSADEDVATLKKRIFRSVEVQIPVAKKQKLEGVKSALSKQQVICPQSPPISTCSSYRQVGMSTCSSPFAMLDASRGDDAKHFAATQPTNGKAPKDTAHPPTHGMSSSIRAQATESSSHPVPRRTRQTTLAFTRRARQDSTQTLKRSTPGAKIPDSILLSSDSSSYSDSELDEDDLQNFADRSSVIGSSPTRTAPVAKVDDVMEDAVPLGTFVGNQIAPLCPADRPKLQPHRPGLDRTSRKQASPPASSVKLQTPDPSSDNEFRHHVPEKAQLADSDVEGGEHLPERLHAIVRDMNQVDEILAGIEAGKIRVTSLDGGNASMVPEDQTNNTVSGSNIAGNPSTLADQDVEDVDSDDVWRSQDSADDGEGDDCQDDNYYYKCNDHIDDLPEDGNDEPISTLAAGQHHPGHKLKSWEIRSSPPPIVIQQVHVASDLPTLTTSHPPLDFPSYEPTTQELRPDFPSSGKVREASSAEQSDDLHAEAVSRGSPVEHIRPSRDQRQTLLPDRCDPVVHATVPVSGRITKKQPKKEVGRQFTAAPRDRVRKSSSSIKPSWKSGLLASRAPTVSAAPASLGKTSGQKEAKSTKSRSASSKHAAAVHPPIAASANGRANIEKRKKTKARTGRTVGKDKVKT